MHTWFPFYQDLSIVIGYDCEDLSDLLGFPKITIYDFVVKTWHYFVLFFKSILELRYLGTLVLQTSPGRPESTKILIVFDKYFNNNVKCSNYTNKF